MSETIRRAEPRDAGALTAYQLDLLFVADRAQGTGLGRRLIEHMLEQAREAGLTFGTGA
ncbi:GNAT family N-acetyltransferase [Nonomuraea endophytica]|uniref:GNAT family N-acetyltransferase n=1 Tax=Nonomuraea endophytica TaxID=714136 RepID=UPI0037C55CB7